MTEETYWRPDNEYDGSEVREAVEAEREHQAEQGHKP